MFLLKAPRWVLITEGVLLIAALLVVAYKAAMWVRPLGTVDQAQFLKKVDPVAKVQEYHVEYPESYIRIGKESWRYVDGTASHTFTLTNQANTTYDAITVEFTYQGRGGKALFRRAVTLSRTLGPLGSVRISGLEIHGVPAASESVLLRVTGAKVAGRPS